MKLHIKNILVNPNKEDKVSNFEIFGPVVTVNEFNNLDKGIEMANSVDVSFQASIFTNRIDEMLMFYEKINASAVFIMTILLLEWIGCLLQALNILVMALVE